MREGYEGATTIRIAEVAGYGVGSLYDYSANKEALATALIDRHAEGMLEMVESTFSAHADAPPETAMRAWVEDGVRANQASPELHKVLIEQVPRVGNLSRLGETEGRVAGLVQSYLERHTRRSAPRTPC